MLLLLLPLCIVVVISINIIISHSFQAIIVNLTVFFIIYSTFYLLIFWYPNHTFVHLRISSFMSQCRPISWLPNGRSDRLRLRMSFLKFDFPSLDAWLPLIKPPLLILKFPLAHFKVLKKELFTQVSSFHLKGHYIIAFLFSFDLLFNLNYLRFYTLTLSQ